MFQILKENDIILICGSSVTEFEQVTRVMTLTDSKNNGEDVWV